MHAGYLAEYAASSFLTHEIIVQCFTADKYCKILPVVLRTVVCTVPVHVLYIDTVLYYAVSCNEENEMFQKKVYRYYWYFYTILLMEIISKAGISGQIGYKDF